MKGYKGFEPGMICRGKQYAKNTIFEEDNAEICKCGMHFCKNPFDVFDYYNIVNDDGSFNEFSEVEALEKPKTDDNKKFCTTKLRIGAKLDFSGFIKACVDFAIEKTKMDSCKFSKLCKSGDEAKIGSSGNAAQIGSSGYAAQIGSSGNAAQIGSSGYAAKIGSSGDEAKIGSSGNAAQIGSSGYAAQIGSSGYAAKINSTGADSVICCAGNNSIVKAKAGSWITLSEWKFSKEKVRYIPACVKTEYVDGERIKADTWYKLVNGEFVEVEQ